MFKYSFKELSIFAIPFVNAISFLLLYLLGENVNYFGAFRIVYFSLVILYFFFFFRMTKSDLPIYLFLGYLMLLIPFSSNFLNTAEFYLKVTVSLMMYPIGYWFVDSKRRFDGLTKTYVYVAVFLIGSFVICQIFGLGERAYSFDQGVLLLGGNRGIYIANLLAYSSIIVLVLMQNRNESKYAWTYKYIFAFSAIIIVLIFRRSAVLALIFGLIINFALTKRKYLFVKYFLVVVLLLIVTSPFYFEKLQTLLELRSYQAVIDQDHGRVQDLIKSYEYITELGFPHNVLGIELFNYREYHNVDRPIHNDYAQLLHGSGFVGLSLFILIFITIWWRAYKESHRKPIVANKQNLFALVSSLIGGILVISAANQLWVVTSFSYVMLYLGSIMGYLAVLNKKRRES